MQGFVSTPVFGAIGSLAMRYAHTYEKVKLYSLAMASYLSKVQAAVLQSLVSQDQVRTASHSRTQA